MKILTSALLIFLLTQQVTAQTKVTSDQKGTFQSETAPKEKPNMFPLAIGNRYQYHEEHSAWLVDNKSYNLMERKIAEDLVINGKRYYRYSGMPDKQYYRYDQDSNKLYFRYNNEDRLYVDFNKGNGSTYLHYPPRYNGSGPLDASVNVYSNDVFGQSKTCFSNSSRTDIDVYTDVFASGIGSIKSTYTYTGGPKYTSNSRLINAVIYDSTGNYTVYSENKDLEYESPPFTSVGPNPVFEYSCLIRHPYNARNWNGMSYSMDGIMFLDSVKLYYNYRKDSSKTEIKSVEGIMEKWGEFKFRLNVDTSLIKHGYVLDYRMVTKDKSLIPKYYNRPASGYFTAVYSPLLGVRVNDISSAGTFNLKQNYPNPFNPETSINFTIAEKGPARMVIFNSVGQQVRVLLEENKNPGSYTIQFDGSGLPSGIYYCRLFSGNSAATVKMVLLK